MPILCTIQWDLSDPPKSWPHTARTKDMVCTCLSHQGSTTVIAAALLEREDKLQKLNSKRMTSAKWPVKKLSLMLLKCTFFDMKFMSSSRIEQRQKMGVRTELGVWEEQPHSPVCASAVGWRRCREGSGSHWWGRDGMIFWNVYVLTKSISKSMKRKGYQFRLMYSFALRTWFHQRFADSFFSGETWNLWFNYII